MTDAPDTAVSRGDQCDDLLDAGHLYTPRYWPESREPWKPEAGQCRYAVPDGGRWPSYHQCTRKAKVTRKVSRGDKVLEVEYCGLHDPVAVKAKDEARRAKWQAQWDAASEQANLRAMQVAALEAIKLIADGHNDPRSLALEVLSKARKDHPHA